MIVNEKKAYNILKKNKQLQLWKYYEILEKEEKRELVSQILKIDFPKMKKLYDNSFFDEDIDLNKVSPLEYIEKEKISKKDKEEYISLGLDIIKRGEYAVVTMAGGSGTRLGFSGPKGAYELELNKERISLFEIQVRQLLEIKEKYNITISWYIMTSNDNYQETINFFIKNNYFNYDKEKIYFFTQKQLPVLDKKGNILLEDKSKILMSSNGNGDVFAALKRNKLLEQMKKSNIKWVLFMGIDNILAKVVDPLFLGATLKNNYSLSSKTKFKKEALEKNAVFAKYNDKPFILLYSYITEEFSNRKDENGYLYRDINIANHLINIKEIEKYSYINMPYHRAYKKSNYYDNKMIIETEANSYKFEKFIFDSFKNTNNMLLYRVGEEEFAPIKNKEGDNSPKTAKALYEKVNK